MTQFQNQEGKKQHNHHRLLIAASVCTIIVMSSADAIRPSPLLVTEPAEAVVLAARHGIGVLAAQSAHHVAAVPALAMGPAMMPLKSASVHAPCPPIAAPAAD